MTSLDAPLPNAAQPGDILRPTPALPDPAPARSTGKRAREANRPLLPLELELTGFAAGGRAVGHAPDGRVAFVEYGIPGERVVAEITDEHPGYLEATAVQVLRASEHRVTAPCP